MSTDLIAAIYERLAGIEDLSAYPVGTALQASLAALLAVSPFDATRPAVVGNANANDVTVTPCLTFRPGAGTMDGRFRAGLAVDSPMIDMEAWDATREGTVATDALELAARLLDRRFGDTEEGLLVPPLPLAAGQAVWLEQMVPPQAIYDDKRNAWAALVRYRAIEARK